MICVYVAGPYSADNVMDVLRNIGKGEAVCTSLLLNGYAPFCPWLDKAYVIRAWKQDIAVETLQNYSMAWLEKSDVVYVLPNWEESRGTRQEITRATELGIPVVYDYGDLELFKHNEELTKGE